MCWTLTHYGAQRVQLGVALTPAGMTYMPQLGACVLMGLPLL